MDRNRQRLQRCHLEHGLASSARKAETILKNEAEIDKLGLVDTISDPFGGKRSDRVAVQSILRKTDAEFTLDDVSVLLRALQD